MKLLKSLNDKSKPSTKVHVDYSNSMKDLYHYPKERL